MSRRHANRVRAGLLVLLALAGLGLVVALVTSVLATAPAPAASTAVAQAFQLPAAAPITATVPLTAYLPVVSNLIPQPVDSLRNGWYLMVDDGHLASRDVERVYHPFWKFPGNPVLRADQPWEGSIVQLYGTVFPGFRMWYSALDVETDMNRVLYAESEDGIHWNKPDIAGRGTNILMEESYSLNRPLSNVLLGDFSSDMVSVIHTPHDAARPYKLMVYQGQAFHGYWSADGTSINPYPQNPLFRNGFDVAHFHWDSFTKGYIGTAKEVRPVRGIPRRVVRFLRSLDYLYWENQPDVFAPDEQDDALYGGMIPHFYGLPIFRYGEQYLGLLWLMKSPDESGLHGQVSTQLVSSHDGVNWIREEGSRPAILDVGPPGAWDSGQIYTASQPVRVGNDLWLYYSGCNKEHGARLRGMECGIGLATAPYNRLVSLSGDGTVLTQPIRGKSASLHLNYNGSQGALRVELVQDDAPIPGYEAENCLPLAEDSLDQVVKWVGQERLPAGRFQIKFYLDKSELFAFAIQ